jgi:hypothetical protein
MRRSSSWLLAGLAGTVLLSGPAMAAKLPSTATPMTPEDVTKVFSGKTLLAPNSDTFVMPQGTTKGVVGKPKITGPFTGTWSVSGNEFCMENVSPGETTSMKDCIKLWRDGRKVYTLWTARSDGKGIDYVDGYDPFLPKTRAGDIVSQRYQKAGGL